MTAVPTLDVWLRSRSELVPDELRERIRFLVRDLLDQPASVESLAEIANLQLSALLQTGVTSREVALDLLAIDAIATYALELAASTGGDLGVSATTVMHTIAHLMDSQESHHA